MTDVPGLAREFVFNFTRSKQFSIPSVLAPLGGPFRVYFTAGVKQTPPVCAFICTCTRLLRVIKGGNATDQSRNDH